MPFDSLSLSYLTRLIHIAAMAVLLGGSWTIWALLSFRTADEPMTGIRGSLFLQYERLAWIALGLLALTGVGNLGAFGGFLPASSTAWGLRLTAKLVLVLVLLMLSLYRSFAVVAVQLNGRDGGSGKPFRLLRALYAATGLLGAAVLALAVSLSHG